VLCKNGLIDSNQYRSRDSNSRKGLEERGFADDGGGKEEKEILVPELQ
jgi:hypothetical protein